MRLESAIGLKQQLLAEFVEPFTAVASGSVLSPAHAARITAVASALGAPRPFAVGAKAVATGDVIVQRATLDGGRPSSDRIGELLAAIRLKARGANLVDAALAVIDDEIEHDPARLRELVAGTDRQLTGLGPDFLDEGETVHKVGRTTGATEGRVTAFDLDNVVVNYDVGNLRFDGQIEIEGVGNEAFSDGGDSGSMIVNSQMQAVALLFAGGDTGGTNGLGLTYANPIHRVLSDLKATLLF